MRTAERRPCGENVPNLSLRGQCAHWPWQSVSPRPRRSGEGRWKSEEGRSCGIFQFCELKNEISFYPEGIPQFCILHFAFCISARGQGAGRLPALQAGYRVAHTVRHYVRGVEGRCGHRPLRAGYRWRTLCAATGGVPMAHTVRRYGRGADGAHCAPLRAGLFPVPGSLFPP